MSMVHQQSEKPVLRRVAGEPFGGPTGDEVLQLALCRIAQLRDEVSRLRQALLSAERASALKEVLLRNALSRELELRAQLVGGMS